MSSEHEKYDVVFEERYEPGNMTSYHLMCARITPDNGVAGWLVSWMVHGGSGGRSIFFIEGEGHMHHTYVGEKMRLGEADARAMADYINNKPEFKRGDNRE